jgi:hypothetical protein
MADKQSPAVVGSLIFFVMLSIILGVTTYMFHSGMSDEQAKTVKAEASSRSSDTAYKKVDNDLTELKKVVGLDLAEVVDPANPNNPQTVTGKMREEMRTLGGTLAQQTFLATLQKLRQELDTTTADRDQITANLNKVQADLLALQRAYQDRSDQNDQKRLVAETQLRNKIDEVAETVNAKNNEINRLRNDYNQIQVEMDSVKDQAARDIAKRDTQLRNLNIINRNLADEVDKVTQVSFETPDGKIARVDNNTRLVWIDLGETDLLKVRTTFSIYEKDNYGVGRGKEDVKGKIEVTRIVGPHLAEARIIDEDIFRPISPGDLIYTPLWSPGRPETFAFIGGIDIDNDKRSDRDLLREVLSSVGATIASEVDDTGERQGGPITEKVKFLVIGDIPDVATASADDERARFEKTAEHLKDMRNEARTYGVRIVSLSDFIAYVGYKPKRRLFTPGDDRPYTLKAGAASGSTTDPIGERSSSGNTSGAFSGNRRLPPKTSSGQTSGAFGGGGKP